MSASAKLKTRNHSQRRGYVLVLTLGLVTLAAISLAGLARYSLGIASHAQEAAEELQRRWGLLSARHVLMERAGDILADQVRPDEANTPPWPKPACLSTTFRLGPLQFTTLVADEQAKVDLNTVYARQPERLPAVIRHVSSDAGGFMVRLTPEKTAKSPFSSWGQVFDLTHSSTGREPSTRLPEISREITCWGTGRLNLCRANDAAIREVASLALSAKDVGELVSHRKGWGGQSVDELLAQLDLRRPQLLAASRLFDCDSRSYSLWVKIDNGQRTWSYQYVDDGGLACFAW